MNKHWMTSLFLVGALGLGAGYGVAQQSPSQRVVGQVIADFNDRQGPHLLDEDIETLTGPEMLQRSQRTIQSMRQVHDGTVETLERARNQERDIVKVNCLNEKLASIKGFLKVSEQSQASLGDAVDRGDDEASQHHYRLIAIAGHRVKGLAEEARVCAGEELRYADDTLLETVIDPAMGNVDEGFFGEDNLVLERLPKISPYY
jgi:hypothetical protein